jgi:hypothetical protein
MKAVHNNHDLQEYHTDMLYRTTDLYFRETEHFKAVQ